MSLIISAATAISPLSLMVAGPLSDAIGILTWFWFGGVVCLLMGVGAFFVLAVLNVESNRNGIESRPDDAPVPVSASDRHKWISKTGLGHSPVFLIPAIQIKVLHGHIFLCKIASQLKKAVLQVFTERRVALSFTISI